MGRPSQGITTTTLPMSHQQSSGRSNSAQSFNAKKSETGLFAERSCDHEDFEQAARVVTAHSSWRQKGTTRAKRMGNTTRQDLKDSQDINTKSTTFRWRFILSIHLGFFL